MRTVPKPYPEEFSDDVVNVARNREPGQTIRQIAADFDIGESCLRNWLRQVDTCAENPRPRRVKR
jgi:transposase